MSGSINYRFVSLIIGVALSLWLIAFVLKQAESDVVFWNPTGLVIVLLGTFASTFLAFDLVQMQRAMAALLRLFKRSSPAEQLVLQMVGVLKVLKRDGVAAAEKEISKVGNPFVRLGLHMAADPISLDDMLTILEQRIRKTYEIEIAEARVFYTMGSFSPAYGMLGTLIGLLGMLVTLKSGDLAIIGQSMAVALITTLYGLLLSHMLFRPLAIKLEHNCKERIRIMHLLADGAILAKMDRTPSQVKLAMQELLLNRGDELNDR